MNFWQLVSAGILAVMLSQVIKQMLPSFSVYVSLAASVMITVASLLYAKPVLEFAREIAGTSRLGDVGTVMLRICAIGVVSSLAADICNDSGETAIGSRITLLGKCAIAITVLPVLKLLIGSTEKFLS